MTALGQVWKIARLTFLEAVRQRFFNFLVLLSLALIGSANFFRQFDFGPQELRFISDFGLGGITFFGSILAIVATAQLFFGEIENRTALTMLAKPVRRWSFIAGKLLGVALLTRYPPDCRRMLPGVADGGARIWVICAVPHV